MSRDVVAPALEFESIVAGYGDTMVLKGVSGRVMPGRILGVFGRNGVGKSTLIKTLAGIIPPSQGRVLLSGNDLRSIVSHRRRRHGVSYAPQERVVFDTLSVAENLSLGFKDRNLDHYEELLATFPRLRDRLSQTAGKLSGGEKKLLSFARVMAERAPLTLIDEPTEGVQQENLEKMAACIRQRAAQGASFIVVEQNLTFLESIADDFVGLDHGEIVIARQARDVTRDELESVLAV